MKKELIGIILFVIDLILIISGITCLIIGYVLSNYLTDTLVEILILYGWLGVGTAIGNLLVILGTTCICIN